MRKKNSKIAEMRAESQECEILMKTFCLNPSRDTYKRISACGSVVRSDNYKVWSMLVPGWCCVGDEEAVSENNKKLESVHNTRREIMYGALIKKLDDQPTLATVRSILYIFAASGWYNALEKFYECMGDSRIAHSSRIELSKDYKEMRELYTAKIQELLAADKDHFTRRGIDKSAVDFTRFDVYQQGYDRKKIEGK